MNLGALQNINVRGLQNVNVPGLNIPFVNVQICPDIILSLVVVAAAAAALALYFLIVGAGRRKRSLTNRKFLYPLIEIKALIELGRNA